MKRGSLRVRLAVAATMLVTLALLIGGAGLFWIFDEALDRRTADELNQTAKLLAGGVGFDAKGALIVDQTPADPRYATPYGGLYWQIEAAGKIPLRSRSLWDKTIALPSQPNSHMAHHETTDLPGIGGGTLIAVFRTILIRSAPDAPIVVITVAMDRRQLAASREIVERLLPPSLFALAAVLALAMAVFVHRALGPFRTLRHELQTLHEGRDARLRGAYPSEVQPLVDDLNRLIAQQENALKQAEAQATDMAHGLKTPLAVLDALARRVADDHPALSEDISEQSIAMQEQVSRTLARARAATGGGLQQHRTRVAPVVERLVAAMKRLPDSERFDWRVVQKNDPSYPAAEGELFEMLGNLVDNARKWARREVIITIDEESAGASVIVEDDGRGMDAAEIAAIGRGRRWDEAVAGSGLGLAITRDLAIATGGQLFLSERREGGLKATIRWSSVFNQGS